MNPNYIIEIKRRFSIVKAMVTFALIRPKDGMLAVLLFSLFIGACGIPERPTVVTISRISPFRPSSPKNIQSVEQALAAIITVCRNELDLPTVDPLYIHLYANTASFALYGRGWRTLSADVAHLIAFAKGNTIHINLEQVGKHPWGDLVPVLAHEYAHIIEDSFAGGTHQIKIWFSEGFADWIGAKVIHFLGWRDYDISLHATMRELFRNRDIIPHLSSLDDQRNWSVLSQKPRGWIRTYGLAFVAVQKIIEENGLVAAISYFKTGNFEANFRRSVGDYGADVTSTFAHQTPGSQERFTMNRPRWKFGENWIYEKREGGKAEKVVMRVMREGVEGGIPGLIVAENEDEFFYSKDNLALITSTKNGRLATRRKPPNRIFDWPLEPGKESRIQFMLEDFEHNSTRAIDRLTVVTALEIVRVPAGTFKAAKIEKI